VCAPAYVCVPPRQTVRAYVCVYLCLSVQVCAKVTAPRDVTWGRTGGGAYVGQLYVLGVLAAPELPFDSDAVVILSQMYQDHGDTIALQYGGYACQSRQRD
jgi:hypothetical protein